MQHRSLLVRTCNRTATRRTASAETEMDRVAGTRRCTLCSSRSMTRRRKRLTTGQVRFEPVLCAPEGMQPAVLSKGAHSVRGCVRDRERERDKRLEQGAWVRCCLDSEGWVAVGVSRRVAAGAVPAGVAHSDGLEPDL
eukprot:1937705-Rhodomonas_salina.1